MSIVDTVSVDLKALGNQADYVKRILIPSNELITVELNTTSVEDKKTFIVGNVLYSSSELGVITVKILINHTFTVDREGKLHFSNNN